MKTAKIILLACFVFFQFAFFFPKEAFAATSLYLSPSGGSKITGQKFNINIYVSADQSTNTYEVRISSQNMTITGVSTGGSICSLYPSQPSYTASSAFVQCGLPTPGFSGGSGYLGNITVQAGSPGTGRLIIEGNSKVLANDGQGTNILTSTGSATFNIENPPTASPTIESSSHPSQDAWYKNNKVDFSWSATGTAYSFLFDQAPSSSPDLVSEGSGTQKSFENVSDGVWYFHIRAQGQGGWSGISHYKVQIDTTPPQEFIPEADPKENADRPPLIAYTATDATSGIAFYEIRLDGGEWKRQDPPYQIERISSGKHTIEVKAVDNAGNERIAQLEFSVKEVPAPEIIEPGNGSTLTYNDHYLIRGRSQPNSMVDIYLDGKKIATVKADENGNFEFTYESLLSAGKHNLYATSITDKNVESSRSKTVEFTVDPKAFIIAGLIIPSLWIYLTSGVLIFLLILIMLFIVFRSYKIRKKIKEILKVMEKQVETDLEKGKVSQTTEDKVISDIEEAEKKI